jgi:hypothetical protein
MSGNANIGVTRHGAWTPAGLFLMRGIGAAVIAVVAGCAVSPSAPEVAPTTASTTATANAIALLMRGDSATAQPPALEVKAVSN